MGATWEQQVEKTRYNSVFLDMVETVHIPAYPDSESGFIRTRYRQHPDSNPEASGHLSGDLIVL